MVLFPNMPQTRILNRIVAPPNPGTQQTSQTFMSPNLYLVNAGANGLQANRLDVRGAIALPRNNETATGSPNLVTAVGSAGTAGLDGAATSMGIQPHPTNRAIVGPGSSGSVPSTVGVSINLSGPLLIGGALILAALVLL